MSIFTNRMEREAVTIKAMVAIYCRHHHARDVEDCPECSEIQKYALDRLFYCPFQEAKTACKNCPVHCYKPNMKQVVKQVMRFSGPRMMMKHPVLTIFHLFDDRRREVAQSPADQNFSKNQKDRKAVPPAYDQCENMQGSGGIKAP